MEVLLSYILERDGYKPRFIVIDRDTTIDGNCIVKFVRVMYRAPIVTEYGIAYCSKFIDIDVAADIVIDKNYFHRRWMNEDLLLFIPDGSIESIHNPGIKVLAVKTATWWYNSCNCTD